MESWESRNSEGDVGFESICKSSFLDLSKSEIRGISTMAIRSEEVNYLVYRYLQESGFEHTAFAFAYESMVADTKVYDEYIPPGTLVSYLQKALQYVEMETHVCTDGTEIKCKAPFSLIHPHKCSLKKKGQQQENGMEVEVESKEIPTSKVHILEGHTSNVISCKWSPTNDSLITGSSDSTVRMWDIHTTTSTSETVVTTIAGPVLSHSIKENGNNEIIDMDWSPNGEMIVSSSYGGEVELWKKTGVKLSTLGTFDHPAFTTCFSPDNEHVLVTGALPSFYIYSLTSEGQVQNTFDLFSLNDQIKQNQEPIEFPSNLIIINSLWRDESCFTLVDSMYRIYNVFLTPSNGKSLQVLAGHDSEINSIDWTSDKSVLLSGADDGIIKLWNDQRNDCVFEFLSHHARINKVLGSILNPSTFFSCSDDCSVKIFDITSTSTIASFNQHDAPVTSIAQSSNNLLASCGLDRYVYINDIRSQQVVKSYRAPNLLNDISFSQSGENLALAMIDSQVYVLDLRV